jgi:hypothetical protein
VPIRRGSSRVLRAESGSYRPMNLPLRAPMLTLATKAAQVAAAQVTTAATAVAGKAMKHKSKVEQ